MGDNQQNNAGSLFKSIYNDSPIGIEIYDCEGKLIDLNQSCMDLFGVLSKEEVKGFNLLNDPNLPKEYLTKLKRQETVHFESKFDFDLVKEYKLYKTTRSGKIYLDVLITPLFLEDNKYISNYLVQIQDVTDQKRAERKLVDLNQYLENQINERIIELRKSEEKYHIFLANFQGIAFQGNLDFTPIFFHGNVQEITGYTEEDFITGNPRWDQIILEEDKNKIADSIKNIHDVPNTVIEREYRILTKDGKYKWLSEIIQNISDKNGIPYLVQGVINDITKRKEAELKLKESEKKYRTLINNILDIIYEIDLDGLIIYLSPQTIDILGYTPDELIGRSAFRFIHPDDQPKVSDNQNYVINSGEVSSVEFRIRNKEGRYITVSSRGQLIEKDGDKRIIGLFRDVTDRRKIEEKVQEEKEKAEMYLNLVHVILVALDKEGNISLINKEGNDILGWNAGELIEKNWFKTCIPPQDRDRVFDYFKKLMRGEIDVVPFYENPIITKEGYEKLIAWSTILLKDSNGRIIGALSSGEDITEKKKAEQLLKESEAKFRTIAEQSLMGIIILQDNRIKYVNSAVLAMLDYTRDELLKMDAGGFINLIHPDDREFVQEIAKKRQMGIKTEVTGYEHRVLKKNGNCIWIQNYSKTINYRGNLADLITVIDITERKKAEVKIQESEKKLTDLIEAVPVGISITTPEGKIIECNSHAVQMHGYESKEELLKVPVINLYKNHSDREKFIELHKKQKVTDFEVQFRRKDSTIFWVTLSSVAYREENQTFYINSFQDITNRKISEIKLQQSEAELSAIYDFMPIAILLVDKEHRIRKINKLALNFTDRRKEEVFGIHGGEALRCLYSEQDPRGCGFSEYCKNCTIHNTILETYKSKKPHINIEATLHLLPGSIVNKVHLLLSTVPLEFAGENLVLICLIDITERKKTEEKLKESEKKYRTVVNNIPGMVYRGKSDWSVEFLSNCEVISGYKEEDFLLAKLNWIDIIHPEDSKSIITQGNKMSERPIALSQTYRIIMKDGSIRWVNDRKISLFDENGVFCGVDGIVYDISDYKIAEEKLRESEEKFRNIAEQTSLGLMIQQEGFIKFANSAVAEIFEYPLKEINNWSTEDLVKVIHNEDLKLINTKMKNVQSENFRSSEQFEYRIDTKSGIKWLEIIAKPIIYLGKKAVFATLIDTTGKKKVEEKLKEVNKLKSELISRTSHELKTPLVSIKGYTDLLLTQHYDLLDYYAISVLHEIKQGCYRLESLIKDLLETSELETGEVVLHKMEEDLSFLIRFCIKDLRGMIEMRNHKLFLDIPDNLITIFEKERIYEVIMNLLSNAIKYTPPDGKISIKSEVNEDNIIISVEDNGIGLNEAEKDKIFKKFGKVERYGKGMNVISEGSGLGLYISKRIIELHGGEIWVESEGRDKGSKFYFSLPRITKK
ncbi:MAG: PAS domain S-box protein [Promethearchaeota archaeon]